MRLAREGRRVVRLKGGDPYIFGRGGEEALALARDGIPFRVLPGLTSGLRRACRAGIPATMRGINKAVILATGHAAGTDDDLDWAAIARTGQPIVVYMGMANLPLIARRCSAGGLAAVDAGRGDRRGDDAAGADRGRRRSRPSPRKRRGRAVGSPALIVVGGIVAMRDGYWRGRGVGMSARGHHRRRAALGLRQDQRHHRAAARACPARPRQCAAPNPARTISIPASTPAATGAARRQSRQLGDAAGPARRRWPREAADDADFVIVESAMGLFDGIPARTGRTGAAADLARLYGLPVLLVLDVSGQSQTAAAVAKGFATYDPAVRIAGVVLNRVGSERHRRLCRRRDRGDRPAGGRRHPARSRRWRCRSAISASSRPANMPRSRRISTGWPT